ncbi:hypothetical protein NBT05_00320 [Aquimarina sp. ERC-38]|uniref:hypothetical protein n=1 Tax=Aquimarina sp. ERC-38 TaxID=2949996 RepID=UPI002247C03D|nr:hypothetical protein [Aquimarina sp. ERC-38]UZO80945.1 hypothetical protein NBT05_00320 [Aquimarina sp. ERC-38]
MIKKLHLILLLILPITMFGQLSEALDEIRADKNAEYEKYEPLLFEATEYIFDNPVNVKSKEFISATQIVGFWMNKDTGMGIPTFGNFFTSLTNENKQQFLYTVAMINYGLDQKINRKRILTCKKIDGQKFSEQEDVREVQLGGAKILLEYIINKKNNVPINSKTKKYVKAYKKGNLDKIFFE